MSKVSDYLKQFFLAEGTYHPVKYRDYEGFGFGPYKQSRFFFEPGRSNPGYQKSDVALYSEMTKIALLTGMAVIAGGVVWLDIRAIQIFLELGLDWIAIGIFWFVLPANLVILGLYPRVVFLIKNFKVPRA